MKELSRVKTNTNLVFVTVKGGSCLAQRLLDMGLTPGEKLIVVNNCGCGPVTVIIRGVKVALGHGLATKIIVKEV
jgi:ferrous iron transport protein A